MTRFSIAFLSILAALAAINASAATRDEQTAACKGDAIRFCASKIPDEQKITSCMKANFSKLSPECKAMFKQSASSKNGKPEAKPGKKPANPA